MVKLVGLLDRPYEDLQSHERAIVDSYTVCAEEALRERRPIVAVTAWRRDRAQDDLDAASLLGPEVVSLARICVQHWTAVHLLALEQLGI